MITENCKCATCVDGQIITIDKSGTDVKTAYCYYKNPQGKWFSDDIKACTTYTLKS